MNETAAKQVIPSGPVNSLLRIKILMRVIKSNEGFNEDRPECRFFIVDIIINYGIHYNNICDESRIRS